MLDMYDLKKKQDCKLAREKIDFFFYDFLDIGYIPYANREC